MMAGYGGGGVGGRAEGSVTTTLLDSGDSAGRRREGLNEPRQMAYSLDE